MAYVAECLDATPPAPGAALSACTNVQWVNEISFSLPDWTIVQYGEIVTGVWLLFVVLWITRAIRKNV